MTRPESSSSALPRRRGPSPVEPAQPPGGPTTRRPDQYVEFNTPPDPASQPVALFPALAPPAEPRPRPRRRRPRIVVAIPMWAVAALALLAIIAGLMFLPIGPWSRAPVESPLEDGASSGAGVVGPVNPEASGGSGAVPGGGVNPGGGAGPSAGPDATAATSAGTAPTSPGTGMTAPGTGTTAPGASTPLQLVDFTASRVLLLGVTGYNVTFKIINSSPVAQSWQNASTFVSETLTVASVKGQQPGVNAYVANGRVCVEPTDAAVATLEPGAIVTIEFRIDVLLSQPPRQGQLDDGQCIPSAAS